MAEDRKPEPAAELRNCATSQPEPYRFENGTLYVPPEKKPDPFVPDQGFDGPA